MGHLQKGAAGRWTRGAAASGVLILWLASSAQAQTTTITLPIPPTALRVAWPAGVDNAVWTDEFILTIDDQRFSLGKPAPVPGPSGSVTLPPTYNVQAPAAAVAALTVGLHTVRMVSKNAAGETPSPAVNVAIATAPPPPPQVPLPAPTGPVTLTVTITVTTEPAPTTGVH